MGLLDKLKAMFGISAARVDVVPSSAAYKLNEPITGQVELVAGRTKQKVAALTISAIKRVTVPVSPEERVSDVGCEKMGDAPEAETGTDEPNPDVADDDEAAEEESTVAWETLVKDVTLSGEDRATYDFALSLGDEAEPTSESVTWLLFARASIPAAVDATCWLRIEVEAAD